MFGANNSASSGDSRIKSIIAAEAFVQGTIRTHGSLIVDGKVEGDIYDAKHVVIGEAGQVQGDITCETVIVGGKVVGNIQAAKQVQILAKGQVIGDIRTKSLHIEDGAVFDGTCTMNIESLETPHANSHEASAVKKTATLAGVAAK
ncbi:MAG: polymer-forming cytoskeletal protein [Elusimicrobia bacterium]|nr:polymer-forming cytoskeletal protein [Elusimicrobiota bacterium]